MNNCTKLIGAAMATQGKSLWSKNGHEKRLLFEADYLKIGNLSEAFGAAPERLSNFEVIWIKTGIGRFTVDFLRQEINHDMMYILFPGQIHVFNPVSDISGCRISFAEEFLYQPGGQVDFPFAMEHQCCNSDMQIMQVDKEMEEEIGGIVRTMIWENCNNFQFKTELLKGLLKIFLAYLSRRFKNQVRDGSNNDIRLFKNFMNLLDQNYLTKKAVADYAEALSVSPNYLSEVIKKVSGHSASHHIQERLILEAKRAAVYADISMKEISYQLGFMDPAQFSKFFKNKAGVNFSEFKKSLALLAS